MRDIMGKSYLEVKWSYFEVKWDGNKLIYDRVGTKKVLWTIDDIFDPDQLEKEKAVMEERLGIIKISKRINNCNTAP